jgi:hypothetical protein
MIITSKHRIQGSYSKYGAHVNILCRNLGQFTAQSRKSLDEAMVLWQGHLRFWMYNPGKITKYEALVRMVRGCIGKQLELLYYHF